jgi:hypothetical protein
MQLKTDYRLAKEGAEAARFESLLKIRSLCHSGEFCVRWRRTTYLGIPLVPERAGWRRPLFLGVCDFPKRLVGVLDPQQKPRLRHWALADEDTERKSRRPKKQVCSTGSLQPDLGIGF